MLRALILSGLLHWGAFAFSQRMRPTPITLPLTVELWSVPGSPGALPGTPDVKTTSPATPEKEKQASMTKKAKEKESASQSQKGPEDSPGPKRPSSSLSLDTARFPYTYYLQIVRNKVASNWHWQESVSSRKAVVYFRILKNGEITDISFKENSGEGSFDQAALTAVTLASPFPPLPPDYPEEDLGVYFEFSLQ